MEKRLKLGNGLFIFLLTYVFYGSLRSFFTRLTKLSDQWFVWLGVFIFGGLLFLRRVSRQPIIKKKRRHLSAFAQRNDRLLLFGMLLVLFLLQIWLLTYITVPIGWDVFDNFYGVTTLDAAYTSRVLSLNTNNQFFFFMMLAINKVIVLFDRSGVFSNTWFSWQVVNCLFLDVSIGLLYFAAKRLFRSSVGYVACFLFVISLGLSPWILTPYTDIMVLPFVCMIVYLYSLLVTTRKTFSFRLSLVGLIGGLLACSFLMKPSSVVFFIAYLGIKLLRSFAKRLKKAALYFGLVCILSFSLTYGAFRLFIENQTIVHIDKHLAKPWTLFVMMGLTGTGGYNDQDTQAVNRLPTQQAKYDYTVKVIQERFSEKGILGYLKFLAQKNINNTANGDFDWGKDGGELVPESESKSGLQTRLRNLYYPQMLQSLPLRFFMQCLYLVTLLGCFFAGKDQTDAVAILKLTFIGLILYLLLFEGGRSRYLIQYLPFLYLLSGVGWQRVIKK